MKIIKLLSHVTELKTGNISWVSHILQLTSINKWTIAKFEKWDKHLQYCTRERAITRNHQMLVEIKNGKSFLT